MRRKRINEELAAALQSTAAELRRQLEAEREGARREFSDAARAEIDGRGRASRPAPLRSGSRCARGGGVRRRRAARDVRLELAGEVDRVREDNRAEIERGLGELDAGVRGLFDALRDEHSVAASETAGEVRRRADARIEQLGVELSERVEREIARKVAEAQSELERAGAASADRIRAEARQGAESAIDREVAKGEARLTAATEQLDLVAGERVDAGIAAVERGSSTGSRPGTSRRSRFSSSDSLRCPASSPPGSPTRRAPVPRPPPTRRGDGRSRRSPSGSRRRSPPRSRRLAPSSKSLCRRGPGRSRRRDEGRRRGVAADDGRRDRRTDAGDSRGDLERSYRDHSRRAEAAATAQLARSLDALKAQRVALGDELVAASREEQARRSGDRLVASPRPRRTSKSGWRALRVETEQAIEQRAAEAVAPSSSAAPAELERRIETVDGRP